MLFPSFGSTRSHPQRREFAENSAKRAVPGQESGPGGWLSWYVCTRKPVSVKNLLPNEFPGVSYLAPGTLHGNLVLGCSFRPFGARGRTRGGASLPKIPGRGPFGGNHHHIGPRFSGARPKPCICGSYPLTRRRFSGYVFQMCGFGPKPGFCRLLGRGGAPPTPPPLGEGML